MIREGYEESVKQGRRLGEDWRAERRLARHFNEPPPQHEFGVKLDGFDKCGNKSKRIGGSAGRKARQEPGNVKVRVTQLFEYSTYVLVCQGVLGFFKVEIGYFKVGRNVSREPRIENRKNKATRHDLPGDRFWVFQEGRAVMRRRGAMVWLRSTLRGKGLSF